ncbi:MAG: SDR family NAD(P)-dependent oxidoreductase [Gammaproteobacteria bacterium]
MTESFRPDALAGRRALVTGASRGIGAAIATALATMGAEVVLAADDEPGLCGIRDAIAAAGGRALVERVDLLDPGAVDRLGAAHDCVDILVNNAAPDQRLMPALEADERLWRDMFGLNLWTPLALCRRIGLAMIDRRGGCIVNVTSIAARNPTPLVAPYACSKAALEILTRVLALELGPHGIRCNAVAPSLVPTQRTRAVFENTAFVQAVAAGTPLRRLATPSDIAGAVAWLASDAAAFVNGQVVTVDGGGYAASPAT